MQLLLSRNSNITLMCKEKEKAKRTITVIVEKIIVKSRNSMCSVQVLNSWKLMIQCVVERKKENRNLKNNTKNQTKDKIKQWSSSSCYMVITPWLLMTEIPDEESKCPNKRISITKKYTSKNCYACPSSFRSFSTRNGIFFAISVLLGLATLFESFIRWKT